MAPRRGLNRPTRRNLLAAGSGLLVAVSTSGCSFFETEAVQRGDNVPKGPKGKEAPGLAALVKAGDLEPVEKRMPKRPVEVPPHDRIGVYGGTWNTAMITEEDASWLDNVIGYEPLVRWKPKWKDDPGTDYIMPGVAESFEIREDGREYRFTLREGLRWSDGHPCTAEDLEFCYNDVNIYTEMHPDGLYSLWTSPFSLEPARFEIIDDLTVRYVFDEPKPGFLNEVAANVSMVLPKHYLQKFHPKYNPDVSDLVEAEGLNDWIQLFEQQGLRWNNPDYPTLAAWRLTTPLGEGTAVVAERNPYYWKVDPEGSQLPYIDEVSCEVLLDVEVEVLKINNGELDMQMRNFSTIRNKPVLARNRERGGFEFFDLGPDGVNSLIIGFNQTHPDPIKRRLYRNKDFRIGLSHAIDRQKVIDTIYAGEGKPWQLAPLEDSPVYDEEMGTQFTAYDPGLANQYLDQAGFNERDGDGMRLGDNGEVLSVVVLVNSAMPDHVDALDLIAANWREVGVELNVQRVAETLYWERVEAGVAEASTWTGGEFAVRATQGSNHYYLPSNTRGSSRFGGTWAHWYVTKGADGEEPPAQVREMLRLFDRMRGTFDSDEATQLGRRVLQIAKEQFFYIGISTPPPTYGIVGNNFHNVPDYMPGQGGYLAPGPTNTAQYFISDQ